MQHFDRAAYKKRKAIKQAAKAADRKALEESREKKPELKLEEAVVKEVDLEPKDEGQSAEDQEASE